MTAIARAKTTRLDVALFRNGVPRRALIDAVDRPRMTVVGYLTGRTKGGDPELRRRLVAAAAATGIDIPDKPWARALDPRAASPLDDPNLEENLTFTRVDLDEDDLTHFGFSRDPFEIVPPEQAWENPRLDFTFAKMCRAIEHRQILAVVGDVGRGKSMLLRKLHSRAWRHSDRVLWMTPKNLNRGQITAGSLAACMLRDLGMPDDAERAAERRGEILAGALEQRARDAFPVLAIDEAHTLSDEGLIAVKRAWDSFRWDNSLAVLLVGQLPLKTTLLTKQSVREVAMRTSVVELKPMTADEVKSYLAWRFVRVGRQLAQVCSGGTAEAIVARGATTPLAVNALTARAFQYARRVGKTNLNPALVARA